jgi:hypothetical protein
MVIPLTRIVGNATRAEDARKARAVSQLRHRECRLHFSSRPTLSKCQSSSSPDPRRCKEQMISNGWCPHQVQHLSKIYNSETFSYLATLETSSQRLANHSRCSESSACIAYNTNAATYSTAQALLMEILIRVAPDTFMGVKMALESNMFSLTL